MKKKIFMWRCREKLLISYRHVIFCSYENHHNHKLKCDEI